MDANTVVLVTGTSSGFGRLIAETLGRKGYRVFATMRHADGRNASSREQLLELARREGLSISVIDLDVTDDGPIERAVNDVRRQRAGLIIHITSAAGRGVLPGVGLYSATKFAVEALAESYRYELSQLGIDSVTVEPGPYPTEIFGKAEAPADPSRAAEYGDVAHVPEGIVTAFEAVTASSQEVADAVVRLIEVPAGQRPLRTLTGPVATSLQPVNDAADRAQREILTSMGMGHLLSVASARP